VEAPVSGSMLLAGILLKLGGYGLVRFMIVVKVHFSFFRGYVYSWGLFGGLFCCFICLRQVDLKSLVAYSSVCHMGMALAGFMRFVLVGVRGGVFMLIGHGLCSSCLFYMLYVFYERFHSRRMILLKGCLVLFPLMGWW
jgi:NADH-ubiquinone oxidoreductase chain 4